MKKVLFVCLGNICRSPMGEGMLKSIVESKGLINNYLIDSAGTSANHIGEKADSRMREVAFLHNIDLTSRSRQVVAEDFDIFDIIIAMDKYNFRNLEILANQNGKDISKIKLMREFDIQPEDMNVPDPYYGGQKGFENVYKIISRSCSNLFDYLESESN